MKHTEKLEGKEMIEINQKLNKTAWEDEKHDGIKNLTKSVYDVMLGTGTQFPKPQQLSAPHERDECICFESSLLCGLAAAAPPESTSCLAPVRSP